MNKIKALPNGGALSLYLKQHRTMVNSSKRIAYEYLLLRINMPSYDLNCNNVMFDN